MGEVSEGFAGVYVADVYFDAGAGNAAQTVAQSDRGMRISACIEYDAIGGEADGVEVVDEFAFDIALEEVQMGFFGVLVAQLCEVFAEGLLPVDMGLARAE